LALASVSTISLWANTQVAACGSDEYLQVDDATGLEILKAAVNCSDGGNVVAVWSGDVTLESPVLVESGTFLTVLGQGGGGAVARGDFQNRLFEVSPGAELTLSKLKLVEGSAHQGGAICSNGSLTLHTCEFVGNVATTHGGAKGGAVYCEGSYGSNVEVNITNCHFIKNSAVVAGGALYGGNATKLNISGCTFEGNS
ncbi:unnamed protein product, partial [Ascophyllum nodosum]